MDVFKVHERLIADYRSFTSGSVPVRDRRISTYVENQLDDGIQWPEPWLSLNPSFESGGTVAELVADGLLHPECERIFRAKSDENDSGTTLSLYRHQRDAIQAARTGKSYVLTTGTGSGKSLAYIVPIVDRVLRAKDEPGATVTSGVKAIVVYPMNALANSQLFELEKFLRYGYPKGREPVTFARYTGQENEDARRRILADPPDILLTNYVMLELVLTRPDERNHLIRAARDLRFLVLDELHTYRGRQGADVALLVRRLRDACSSPRLQVVGTSATMASGGSVADQKVAVADVATRLFGDAVTPDLVIGETLTRATTAGSAPPAELAQSVRSTLATSHPTTYAELRADPLAAWVESTFGLDVEPESTRLVRRIPTTVAKAAFALAQEARVDREDAEAAIRSVLLAGSQAKDPSTSRPLFAFRLHQFLSKGDTVHVSLEPEDIRHITSTYQQRVPGHREKALLPLGFCRECGQEYVVVAKATRQGVSTFVPRQDADASGGDAITGYIYVSSDLPWSVTPLDFGRLPEHWVTTGDSGEYEVLPNKAKYLPEEVWVAEDGTLSAPGTGLRCWFVSTPFTFCMRCRVSYEQVRGNDYAKLATLDREGRSSAVSLIGASIVRSLREVPSGDLPVKARKLLTFVDNRQDASLQAGHFNDFVQVSQLRGALHRATGINAQGLTHESVAQQVTAALGLGLAEYAANPGAQFTARSLAEKALRALVEYRLYADLRRGFRITMPNLEQTGLLHVRYLDLSEIASHTESWVGTMPALRECDAGLREELARILLDELRKVLAIDVDCLTQTGFERLVRESSQHLTGPWSLGDGEQLTEPGTAYPGPSGRGRRSPADLFISGRSAFGSYLRREGVGLGRGLTTDDAQRVIGDIFRVLERTGLLTVTDDRDGIPGYQIKASTILWVAGDGSKGADDPLRKSLHSDLTVRVNPFFKDLYKRMALSLGGLHAKEHTAQVPPDLREEREEEFREGRLPLLYCSPTMELGVDIADLNAVGLRNVPPTPANYAQRSGRAGRSGHPALVVTYCATGNAHDTYYFRHSQDMVAGSVAPPRLDLANEDLVRSHVHAIWLAETGQSLKSKITDLVEATGDAPTLTLYPDIWRAFTEPEVGPRATRHAEDVVDVLRSTWGGSSTPVSWWYDGWVADQVTKAPQSLDRALERWRTLYRTARLEYAEQSRLAIDPKANRQQRESAARRAYDARQQLDLLANETSERNQSDFYSYRYLASEGFLPGYSFPRLPLAAYIPGRRGPKRQPDGTYLQRPRFLAISEFGPGALIYHEGARYEVMRVQLPRNAEIGTETEEARRCEACGYHHAVGAGTDVCDNCHAKLGAKTYGLLRLQTVFTRRRERISSDEEERRRSGFELETAYRFHDHGDRPGRLDAEADNDGATVAGLSYGDSATVRVANVGRRRRKGSETRGYWLDLVEGRWLTEKAGDEKTGATNPVDTDNLDAAEDVAHKARVIPYVEDRRNILTLRLTARVDDITATTLRYALERGIEATFQLEDSELISEPLPDLDSRGRMLLTESAEGGPGVLRRLVAEPGALARAARTALQIAHFHPETGTDLDHADGATERCEQACYDCLLSYGNQYWHSLIDRHAVRDLLMLLAGSAVTAGAGGCTRGEQRTILDSLADSSLERRFVTWLDERGLRLPDHAQVTVTAARARPDLVYDLRDGRVAVFIDGPVHDTARQRDRDAAAEERLVDAGWFVVRVRYDQDWDVVIRRHPSVFGTAHDPTATK